MFDKLDAIVHKLLNDIDTATRHEAAAAIQWLRNELLGTTEVTGDPGPVVVTQGPLGAPEMVDAPAQPATDAPTMPASAEATAIEAPAPSAN